MNEDYKHIRSVIENEMLSLEDCKLLSENFYSVNKLQEGCAEKYHSLVALIADVFKIEIENF